MSSNIILWSFFRSSASWRVRIALNLKGIEYEYRPVNLAQSEQLSDQFSLLNAKQEVPLLQIDGMLISQSLPIIEYLDETRVYGSRLLPRDPVRRVRARQLAEIINSGVQPYQNTTVQRWLAAQFGEEKRAEWLQLYLHKGFRAIEEQLRQHGGRFCVGDRLTVADLFLVPQVSAAKRFGVDVDEYERVSRVCRELEEIPEFVRAHPSRQPDTPVLFRHIQEQKGRVAEQ